LQFSQQFQRRDNRRHGDLQPFIGALNMPELVRIGQMITVSPKQRVAIVKRGKPYTTT